MNNRVRVLDMPTALRQNVLSTPCRSVARDAAQSVIGLVGIQFARLDFIHAIEIGGDISIPRFVRIKLESEDVVFRLANVAFAFVRNRAVIGLALHKRHFNEIDVQLSLLKIRDDAVWIHGLSTVCKTHVVRQHLLD